MGADITLDEKNYKNILDGMVDGVITINQEGTILTFNKTAETIFGYKSDEAVGQNVSFLMPEPDSSAHDSYINKHITSGENHIIGIGRDVIALRKNGETFPMRLSVIEYPAKIEGDRWFIGSCRDITKQKLQDEQLKRSLKMDAIGKITSGIAHDYNNVLGIILGYSEILEECARKYDQPLDYIQQIRQAALRASSLTNQLLSITRSRPNAIENTKINEVIYNNRELLSKTLTSKIALSIKTADNIWSNYIDKGCLEDVILNLSINAMHAMPEGGELEITTSNNQVHSIEAQVLNITPGDYVKLTVSDTGTGMTDDIKTHIFEPFYSTKGEKGTGLGLSQVFNFIQKSKGAIQVYSELGHGTRFSIFLPRSEHELEKNTNHNSSKLSEDELEGTESILIVDDEQGILDITREILSSHGYKTFCASSAEEALKILKNESIDLVISDVIMPDTDGFELAHIIKHVYPNVKIQLYSGFRNPKGKSVTDGVLSKKLLEKPFTSNQLLTNVHDLLSRDTDINLFDASNI